MSHWNYRVLAFKEEDETFFQVRDVYYDDEGKPNGYSSVSSNISSDTVEGLKQNLKRIEECFEKPTLSGDNFPEEWKSENKG